MSNINNLTHKQKTKFKPKEHTNLRTAYISCAQQQQQQQLN